MVSLLASILILGTVSPVFAVSGTVNSFQKISATEGGLIGPLGSGDQFGRDIANMGDIDGDGVNDLAVGVLGDDDNAANDGGAVYILFMNNDGTVKSEQKITDASLVGVTFANRDFFGSSVVSIGDLDGNGVTDLAVGAMGDGPGSGGGFGSGAVYILFLEYDGNVLSVLSNPKIENGFTNFGSPLGAGDHFGVSVANLGDLDGDGVTDLAVGAEFDDDSGFDSGAVYVIFLNTNGAVKSVNKLTGIGFGGQDGVGTDVASLGDLDGAGPSVVALAAGANGAPFPSFQGQVNILFLNSAGSVLSSQKIGSGLGGFGGTIDGGDVFSSVENAGDLDGDGVTDLAVGIAGDDDGGSSSGGIWIVFLNDDGTVKDEQKISDTEGNFGGTLAAGDFFGYSVANMGDLDGDGVNDLAGGGIGAGGTGAVWILFMDGVSPPSTFCDRPIGDFDNVIIGTAGDDRLSGTSGDDLIDGKGGNDSLKGNAGNDCLIGGPGSDKLSGGSGNDYLQGDDGADSLAGGSGDDFILGGAGNDRISGGLGNDELHGGAGDDQITGRDGSDSLFGDGDNDILSGGDGNDTLNGGDGNDAVLGRTGNDGLSGGAGSDICIGGSGINTADTTCEISV